MFASVFDVTYFSLVGWPIHTIVWQHRSVSDYRSFPSVSLSGWPYNCKSESEWLGVWIRSCSSNERYEKFYKYFIVICHWDFSLLSTGNHNTHFTTYILKQWRNCKLNTAGFAKFTLSVHSIYKDTDNATYRIIMTLIKWFPCYFDIALRSIHYWHWFKK